MEYCSNKYNPISPEALNINDLSEGREVEVIDDDKIALRGVIATLPEYGEGGWNGCTVRLRDTERTVPFGVYDNGLTCFPDGSWSEKYTREAAFPESN